MPPEPSPSRDQELSELLTDSGWLEALACSMVGDPFLAEDLTQETLVRSSQSRTWPSGRLRSYAAGILRNLVRQEVRAKQRRLAREQQAAYARLQALRGASANAVPDPAQLSARAEQQLLVVTTLLALEEASRDILLLKFYSEASMAEIAAKLGISLPAAESRLRRARVLLRERLEERQGKANWAMALVPLLPLDMAPPTSPPPSWLSPLAVAGLAVLIISLGLKLLPDWEAPSPAPLAAATPTHSSGPDSIPGQAAPIQRQAESLLPPAATPAAQPLLQLLDEHGQGVSGLRPNLRFLRPATVAEQGKTDAPWLLQFKRQAFRVLGHATGATDADGILRGELPAGCTEALLDLNLHSTTLSMEDFGRGYAMIPREAFDHGPVPRRMLARSGLASGTITTPAGAPLPGAEVDWIPLPLFHDAPPAMGRVQSDAQGAFRMDAFASSEGGLLLQPRLQGYLPYQSLAVMRFDGPTQEDREIRLQMVPSQGLPVQVVDASGLPVSGATVVLASLPDGEPPAYAKGAYRRGWTARGLSDESGQLVLEAARAGNFRCTVNAPGFAPWHGEVAALPPTLVVKLQPGSELEVLVTADGRAVPEAMVRLLQPPFGMVEEVPQAVTDAKGRARFHGIPQGAELWVAVAAPGYQAWLSPKQGMAAQEPLMTVALQPGLSVQGMVEGWRGLRPSADPPMVYLAPRDSSQWERGAEVQESLMQRSPLQMAGIDRVKADQEGRFRFDSLAPGHYRLWFGKRELPLGVVEVEAGEQDVHLMFEDGLSRLPLLSGTIHQRDGQPIPKAYLIVRRFNANGKEVFSGPWQSRPPLETIRDPQGHFRVMLPEAGLYQVTAWVPQGFITVAKPRRQFSAGEHALDFTLDRARPLSLRLLDQAGAPVAGAKVEATLADGSLLLQPTSQVLAFRESLTTAADGSLLLPALPATLDFELHLSDHGATSTWSRAELPSPGADGVVSLTTIFASR